MNPAQLSDNHLWRSITASVLLLVAFAAGAVEGNHVAVDLTPAETQWLSTLPLPIRRGADPAWPPFEFQDKSGIYAGMCQDYTNIIVERLHLQLELVPGLDWNEVLDGIRDRKLDVISCISMTPDRETYLAFSKPFITSPQVIFTRDDYPYISGLNALQGKPVAAVKGYSITDILARDHPKLKLVLMDNTLEALHAVAVGQADAFIDTLAVGIYYIRQQNLANLKVAAPARVPPLEMRFGFRKDWWPFVPIVEKALDTITPEEHTAIEQNWVNVSYDPLVDYTLLWKVGGTLTVLLLLAALWIRQVQQQKRALQASEKRLMAQRDTLKRLTEDLEVYGDRVARELKMARETHKILGDDSIRVSCTCVRVPVINAHSEALHVSFKKPVTPEAAREVLAKAEGVELADDIDKAVYPMPLDADGREEVLVGRIRKDQGFDNGLSLFVAGDNLWKGAALNAIQIAEKLIEQGC